MASIGQFLDSIGEFFTLAWRFFDSFLAGLGNALDMIFSSIPLTTTLAGLTPAFISGSIIISISIGVVKFVLGR